jgi:hypothetical protein
MSRIKLALKVLKNKDFLEEYVKYYTLKMESLDDLIDETELWIDEYADKFFITREGLENNNA